MKSHFLWNHWNHLLQINSTSHPPCSKKPSLSNFIFFQNQNLQLDTPLQLPKQNTEHRPNHPSSITLRCYLSVQEAHGRIDEIRDRRKDVRHRDAKRRSTKLYENNGDYTAVSSLARQAGNLLKWWREMGDACGPNQLPRGEKEELEEGEVVEEEEEESFETKA